jgi:DNA-binding MarR family transcriptional regulator
MALWEMKGIPKALGGEKRNNLANRRTTSTHIGNLVIQLRVSERKQDYQSDFVRGEGLPFLAHLLRRISDEFVHGCEQWYPTFGLIAPPRTASTLHLLLRRGPQSVTDIAAALRQSHPLIITWVRQLKALDLIATDRDLEDRRRTIVSLTERGIAEAARMLKADKVIERAYRHLMREADAPILDALWRLEAASRDCSFLDRLNAAQAASDD